MLRRLCAVCVLVDVCGVFDQRAQGAFGERRPAAKAAAAAARAARPQQRDDDGDDEKETQAPRRRRRGKTAQIFPRVTQIFSLSSHLSSSL